jgi:hypothetical protein
MGIIFFSFFSIICCLLSGVFVYKDARELGEDHPLVLGLLTILFWLIALPVYLIMRKGMYENATSREPVARKHSSPIKIILGISLVFILITVIAAVIAAFVFGMAGSVPSSSSTQFIPITTTSTSDSSASPSANLNSDMAVVSKLLEMSNHLAPMMDAFATSASNHDTGVMRSNAVAIREYIDENLPGLQKLVNGASTTQVAAQEYIRGLEDERTGMNEVIQGVDAYNSGDYAGATALFNSATQYIEEGTQHLQNSAAEIKSVTPK